MTAYSLPQSSLQPNLSLQCLADSAVARQGCPEVAAAAPPGFFSGGGGERYCLTPEEWEALEDLAMSLHGVMRLIEESGFDNSSGAQELLVLVYRRFEKLLSQIRSRLESDDEV